MFARVVDLKYPDTKKIDQTDDYHGTQVADPYRWLEDLDSQETEDWVGRQNEVTFDYLSTLSQRPILNKRLTQVWNYERFSLPLREAGKYFYSKNDGLQNQGVLYSQDNLEGEAQVLLDPNTLSEDGTVALADFSISRNGRYMVYAISRGGSDWSELLVRDIQTGADLDDHLMWVKFSGLSWDAENEGFYYSRYDQPSQGQDMEGVNEHQKLCYHKVGTDQSSDIQVFYRPEHKDWGFGGFVSEDGQYLINQVWLGTEPVNGVFYKDLARNGEMVLLLAKFDAEYTFVGNIGPTFYFKTDYQAPMGRVISLDINQPEEVHWKTVIPETIDALQAVSMVGGGLVANYLKDAISLITYHQLDGSLIRTIPLPGPGSVTGFGGKMADKQSFYFFTNYVMPTTVFLYNFETGESTVFRSPEMSIDLNQYVSEQVFYRSKDGTRIPMTLSHKKGRKLDGKNPTLLTGYGGFNISLTPAFGVENMVFMERGGILAVPNLRGGGEYGRAWHEAGMKERRQDVFDDFISAAEWLIDNRYTSPEHLGISGGSNGGLLVSATMIQRPDLFAAVIPIVGVLDMLRYHKFTIGWAWVSDYGSAENPEEFKVLYAYSPLHNLTHGVAYPPTLIVTSDRDDRVVPSHSFKFAATLQQAHAGENPVLIRVETQAGHGAGTSTAKRIEGASDRLAFLFEHTRRA